MVQSLTTAPTTLLVNPRIGEKLEEFEPREVRRIFVGRYEVRYEIQDTIIYMLRLWHTCEDRRAIAHKFYPFKINMIRIAIS